MARRRRKRWHAPGTMPGTLVAHAEAGRGPVSISLFRYAPDRCEERPVAPAEIASLSAPHDGVLWVNVNGLSDPSVVRALGERFGFHPLALEDVLNVPQRPKVERYGDTLHIVLQEIRGDQEPEQISLFLSERLLVTFQERPGDAFEPVRERLRTGAGLLRSRGADHLAYALCDAVLDAFFPALERIAEELEALEDRVIAAPVPDTFREIQRVKRRLVAIRRAVWPARDAMGELLREESPLVRPETKVYLRDCYDHAVQVMDMAETYREMASSLVDEYMSSVSNRMNEIMKVLTVIATVFIPLTFIAGIYGMNFDPKASPYNMPELGWRYGYPAVLLVMAAVVAGMIWFFRRKKWM